MGDLIHEYHTLRIFVVLQCIMAFIFICSAKAPYESKLSVKEWHRVKQFIGVRDEEATRLK